LSIDPAKVPFPFLPDVPPVVYSGRSGEVRLVEVPDALAAGTAQWRFAYLRKGSQLPDSEGVLAFYQNHLTYFADSGETTTLHYTTITSYLVRRPLLGRRFMKLGFFAKLWLRVPGHPDNKFKFGLGPELSANAQYILTAAGVES
jgi:hypothetical protein